MVEGVVWGGGGRGNLPWVPKVMQKAMSVVEGMDGWSG